MISDKEKLSYLNQFCRDPARLQALSTNHNIHQMHLLSALFITFGELAMYFGDDDGAMAAKTALAALMWQPIDTITIIPSKEKLSSNQEASKQLSWVYSQTILVECEEIRTQVRFAEMALKREPTNFQALIAVINILHHQILFNEKHAPIDMTNPPDTYYLDLTHLGKFIGLALNQLPTISRVSTDHGKIMQTVVPSFIQHCLEYVTLAPNPNPLLKNYLHQLTINSKNLCYIETMYAEQALNLIQLIILTDYLDESVFERLKTCKNLINRVIIDSDRTQDQLEQLKQLNLDVNFKLINFALMEIISKDTPYHSQNQSVENILLGLRNLSYYMLHYPRYTSDLSLANKAIEILLANIKNLNKPDQKKAKKEIKEISNEFFNAKVTNLNIDQTMFKETLKTLMNPPATPKSSTRKLRAPKSTRTVTQPKVFDFTLAPKPTITKEETQQTRSLKHADFLLGLLEQNTPQATIKKNKKKKDRRVKKGPKEQPLITTAIAGSEPLTNTQSESLPLEKPCITVESVLIAEQAPIHLETLLTVENNLPQEITNIPTDAIKTDLEPVSNETPVLESTPKPSPLPLTLNPTSQLFDPLTLIPAKDNAPVQVAYEIMHDEQTPTYLTQDPALDPLMSFRQQLIMKSSWLNTIHEHYKAELNKELILEIESLYKKLEFQDLHQERMQSLIPGVKRVSFTTSMSKEEVKAAQVARMNDLIKLEQLRFLLKVRSITVSHAKAPRSQLALEYQAFSQWITKHTGLRLPAYTEAGALPITPERFDDFERAYQRTTYLSTYARNTLAKIESDPDLLVSQPDLILFVLHLQVHKHIVIKGYLDKYIHDFSEQIIKNVIHDKTKEFLLMDRVWEGLKEGDAYSFFIKLLETKCFKVLFPALSERMDNSRAMKNSIHHRMRSLSRLPAESRSKRITLDFLKLASTASNSAQGFFQANNRRARASNSIDIITHPDKSIKVRYTLR